MKPLVLWCRWHDARLRLHGRDENGVWGELVFFRQGKIAPFDFKFLDKRLTIQDTDPPRMLTLDEHGVPIVERD